MVKSDIYSAGGTNWQFLHLMFSVSVDIFPIRSAIEAYNFSLVIKKETPKLWILRSRDPGAEF